MANQIKPRWFKSKLFLIIAAIILLLGWKIFQPRLPRPLEIFEVTNPNGFVDLSFNPDTATAPADQSVNTDITIDTGAVKITAVQVELDYDPAKLTVNSVTPGDFLTGPALADPNITNGKVTFTFAAPANSGGVQGTGILATINVNALNDTSALAFTTQTLVAAIDQNGNPIATNTLRYATDATFSLGTASPSPSPAETPSPEPSVSPEPSSSPNPSSSPEPSVSPAPSASPQPSASPAAASSAKPNLQILSRGCHEITLGWDKINNSAGYFLDLAENTDYTNFKTSGRIPSWRSSYTFTDLNQNYRYFVRATQADIPDFPQFSGTLEARTENCASGGGSTPPSASPNPKASASPKASLKPSAKPSTSPSPKTNSPRPSAATSSAMLSSLRPSPFQFSELPSPAPETPVKNNNLFISFLKWLWDIITFWN